MVNRKRYGALGVAVLVTTGVLMSAGSIFADPKPLQNPPFHRHYIVQPDGTRVQVGPDLCENPEMQDAFNQFHYNVHVGSARRASRWCARADNGTVPKSWACLAAGSRNATDSTAERVTPP